jgi:hypothetical protein
MKKDNTNGEVTIAQHKWACPDWEFFVPTTMRACITARRVKTATMTFDRKTGREVGRPRHPGFCYFAVTSVTLDKPKP